MGKVVAAVAAILVALALATGGTITLVSTKEPDKSLDFENAPAVNSGTDAVVDYGVDR